MDLNKLKIDPEFEEKIPPLTQEELELLENNIVTDGRVLDPLIIWNDTILDGHNRYRILMKHPEIPFVTFSKDFPNRYMAIAWICNNQLGRRNLTVEQKRYLVGKRYEAEKASHGGARENERTETGQFTASLQNEDLRVSDRTSARIAEELNTSRSYVERAEKYAQGIDAAEEALPGIKREILSGSIRPTQAAVAAIAQAAPEERTELAELLRQPRAIVGDDTEIEGEDIPICVPKRKEILELAESMNHSKGQAIGTIEDMIYEMNSALEDMMFRWNFCKEVYPKHVRSRNGKKLIKLLAKEGLEYFTEIRRGALWKDAPEIEREEEK